MPSALDRLRDRKKANHRDVPICTDSQLIARQEELTGKLQRLKTRLKISNSDERLQTEISDAEDELAELGDEILRASEWIRIKALAPNDYEELIEEHKPTKDQLREARKIHGPRASLQWNTDTFPNALLAASAYVLTVSGYDGQTGRPIFAGSEEQLTVEFLKEMREDGAWSSGEIAMLLNTATAINESTANVGAAGNA